MVDLVMKKRGAARAGEIGFFIDSELFEEEFASVKIGAEVEVNATTPRSLRQLRYAWALCAKVADACDWLDDRTDTMDFLKMKARHVRYVVDHRNGETWLIPKSIRFASMDQTAFQRLMNRMIHVVVTEIVPGLDESSLRREIEAMVGIEPPDAPKPRTRKRPGQPSQPDGTVTKTTANKSDRAAPAITLGGTHTIQSQPVSAGTHGQPSSDGSRETAGLPKTAAEWMPYAVGWLNAARDNQVSSTEIMHRWTAELKLRIACGLTPEDRDPVFELYTEIIDELRKREGA